MYDHLVGEVVEKHASRIVVRCGGIGYECRVSLTTVADLTVGATHQVFTLLHVVDGTPSLLGFATRDERDLTRRLLSVSSVGPSIALALLSVYTPGELAGTIARGDVPALRRVKGIGQKIAERLCLELRDAMTAFQTAAAGGPSATLPMPPATRSTACAGAPTPRHPPTPNRWSRPCCRCDSAAPPFSGPVSPAATARRPAAHRRAAPPRRASAAAAVRAATAPRC